MGKLVRKQVQLRSKELELVRKQELVRKLVHRLVRKQERIRSSSLQPSLHEGEPKDLACCIRMDLVRKLVRIQELVHKQELVRKLVHKHQQRRSLGCASERASLGDRHKQLHHRRIPNQLLPCRCPSTDQQTTLWRRSPYHPKKFGSSSSNPQCRQ